MVTQLPHPGLRPGVRSYRGFRLAFERSRRRLEVPNASVTLVLGFGDPLRINRAQPVGQTGQGGQPGTSYTSLLSGLHTRASVGEHDGRAHGIEVVMAPWTAFTLFRTPMAELADSMVDLADLLGRPAYDHLAGALAETPGWAARFTLLDTFLTSRARTGPPVSHRLVWAWRQLVSGRATGSTVAKLAGTVGWSERHLERRFREQIGLSPKATARVLRFRHALRLLDAHLPLSQIAAACGYYDQAHLNRDFKAMTGRSPSRFITERTHGAGFAQLDREEGQVTSVVLTGH
ncbi:helix-turn-helix domain-containing protein [Streptomyces sp. NPDC102405]|jgi:AraC-like DNA-binding protein|uniref:helix-turn-helix domain-containing protein n=1 Tax=Streptomyces sp. NPDC102405 TaxID=3366170 RepID=UPI0038008C50